MKILAIGAHADDLELSCGGFLAKLARREHKLFAIIATKSDYINYDGKIERTQEEADYEGKEALRLIGIPSGNIWNLGFETKKVPYNEVCIEKINHVLDIVQPDVILTHSLSSSHQDHINTSKATMAAARRCKNVLMYEPLYPDKMTNTPFKPMVYTDISGYLEQKLKALQAHKSQWKKYPEWIDLVSSLARLRGIEGGYHYAEAFEPVKMSMEIYK